MSDTPNPPAAKRRRPPAARKAATAKATKPPAAAPAPSEPSAPVTDADLPPFLFACDIAVRWRDLDAFNHVNNSTFLTYLEEARLAWLESLPGPWLGEHSAPVLAAASLNYRRPIQWPETVRVKLFRERTGRSSIGLVHHIVSARDEAVLYSEGTVVMVWVDGHSGKAAELPAAVRAAGG